MKNAASTAAITVIVMAVFSLALLAAFLVLVATVTVVLAGTYAGVVQYRRERRLPIHTHDQIVRTLPREIQADFR